MAYRVRLADSGETFEAGTGEPILAAAARAGIVLPHACTLGGCGTCRVKVDEGRVAYAAMPLALGEEEAAQGYALACQARAASDLVLTVPRVALTAASVQSALVTGIEAFASDVMHLALVLPDLARLAYRPGQHMNVRLEDGAERSFSMASAPDGNGVDFHIRRIPGGRFTGERLAALAPGDLLEVELPLGTFRFHPEDEREVILVATGTGISPFKAMLEALTDDPDCPPVSLYWGMRTEEDLYLDAHIRRWAERLFEFRYVPVLSRADGGWGGRRGHVQQAVLEDFGDLSQHSVYLCGSPAMIRDAKAAFAAHGASVERTYADGFTFQRSA